MLPGLLLIWANLHGSFILGLGILLVWLGAELILRIAPRSWAWQPEPLRYSLLGRLLLATLLAAAATFANPYFQGVWVEALRTLGDRELHNNIVEWFSPEVRSQHGVVLFGTMLLWIFSLALRKTRVALPTLAVTAALLVGSMLAVRNLPLFFLLAVPQIILTARQLLPGVLHALRVWPLLVIGSALVVFWIGVWVPVGSLWRVNQSDEAFLVNKYPVGAARYLAEHAELDDTQAYNAYGWGGYLLLNVPGFKTFIDGRMPSWRQDDLKIMDEYFKLDRLESGWPEVLDKYEVDLIVLPPSHKLIAALLRRQSEQFKEVFRDEQAVILLKK